MRLQVDKANFNQHLECAAPKLWLENTTPLKLSNLNTKSFHLNKNKKSYCRKSNSAM